VNRIISFACLAILVFSICSFAAVKGEEVTYSGGGATMKGYLAYDDAKGKRPGVLVVHEWWGLNDYARSRARKLAEAGYTALALDMFGDGKSTTHPEDAKKFTAEAMSNMDNAKARFAAAMKVLKDNPHTDATKIAAIGYCFGGGVVLNMAASGMDLNAVASFHGDLHLSAAPKPGDVKAKIHS